MMADDPTPPTGPRAGLASLAADVHDKAVIESALAVLGGMRREWSKIKDARELLHQQLAEIYDRIQAR